MLEPAPIPIVEWAFLRVMDLMSKIDGNDLLIGLGMMILGVGIGMVSIPAALIVLGGLLFALGIYSAMVQGAAPKERGR